MAPTADPIRFSGSGSNFYVYTKNSPVNASDPSGLCSQNDCAPSGSAPPPGFYAQLGESASWLENDIYLASFKRGHFLDAQVQYGGTQDYANYVFGVYMAAAGYSTFNDAECGECIRRRV